MEFFVELNGNKLKNEMFDEIFKVIKKADEIEIDKDIDYFGIKIYDKELVKEIDNIIDDAKKGK